MKRFLVCIVLFAIVMLPACASEQAPSSDATPTPAAAETTTGGTTQMWPEPDKLIALTFDDGPSSITMVQVLDLLAEYDAKATFFIIGRKINASTKSVLQRAVEEGHELGNHSFNHLHMAELSEEEIVKEYNDCHQAVLDAVGVEMHYFRPPFNSTDSRMYELIPAPFMVGISAGDGTAEGSIAADRAFKVTSKAYDGAIVVMHCFQGNDETVEALQTILPELKAQGYKFVTVSELYLESGCKIPGPTPGVKFYDNKPIE